MEWFTIVLSSLLGAISPVGVILDNVVASNLRSQLSGVEQLAVRIDNTPSHQVLQGKIDRVRIASRGVEPIENLRIEAIELETDPIDLDISRLQQGGLQPLIESLRKPLQGGIHLIIKESDLNVALQSPNIKAQLQQLINRFLPAQAPKFELLSVRLDFSENNRLGVQVQLQEAEEEGVTGDHLDLASEVRFQVIEGRSLQLLDLSGTLNGRKLSQRFLNGLTEGINQQLDLRKLETQGIVARILQLNLDQDTLDLAVFFRLNPDEESQK